jgi:hypothetical protein
LLKSAPGQEWWSIVAVELGQVMVGDGDIDSTLALIGSSVFKAFKTLNEGEEGGGG